MRNKKIVPWIAPVACAVFAIAAGSARGSDHADPVPDFAVLAGLSDGRSGPEIDEGLIGLAGLFAFPDPLAPNDNLIVMIHAGRSIVPTDPTADVPEEISTVSYKLHFDFTTPVLRGNDVGADVLADSRFGGKVADSTKIHDDAVIEFKVQKNPKVIGVGRVEFSQRPVASNITSSGFKPTISQAQYDAGLYDDPFIFATFMGVDIYSMTAKIPFSAIPAAQRSGVQRRFTLWATAERVKDGKLTQFDIVGRAGRSQQPRLDVLNTFPPSQHVEKIKEAAGIMDKMMADPDADVSADKGFHPIKGIQSFFQRVKDNETAKIRNFLMLRLAQLFAIRGYDFAPDVMFYSMDQKVGYPNGQKLGDDVVKLTCFNDRDSLKDVNGDSAVDMRGECQLYEIAVGKDASVCPDHRRRIRNDKNFTTKFPYLAEPYLTKGAPICGDSQKTSGRTPEELLAGPGRTPQGTKTNSKVK